MADTSYIAIASQYNKAAASAQTLANLGFTAAQIDAADAAYLSAATATVFFTVDSATPSATIFKRYSIWWTGFAS